MMSNSTLHKLFAMATVSIFICAGLLMEFWVGGATRWYFWLILILAIMATCDVLAYQARKWAARKSHRRGPR